MRSSENFYSKMDVFCGHSVPAIGLYLAVAAGHDDGLDAQWRANARGDGDGE
jgi:hypothetical protein